MRCATMALCACAATGPAYAQWSVGEDYPAKALREGRQGTTHYRLVISQLGGIDDCIITQSSGHADLDEATCNMLKRRARFRPAKDVQGLPMGDTYSGQMIWRIP